MFFVVEISIFVNCASLKGEFAKQKPTNSPKIQRNSGFAKKQSPNSNLRLKPINSHFATKSRSKIRALTPKP